MDNKPPIVVRFLCYFEAILNENGIEKISNFYIKIFISFYFLF
jgi:hypothetical protein